MSHTGFWPHSLQFLHEARVSTILWIIIIAVIIFLGWVGPGDCISSDFMLAVLGTIRPMCSYFPLQWVFSQNGAPLVWYPGILVRSLPMSHGSLLSGSRTPWWRGEEGDGWMNLSIWMRGEKPKACHELCTILCAESSPWRCSSSIIIIPRVMACNGRFKNKVDELLGKQI